MPTSRSFALLVSLITAAVLTLVASPADAAGRQLWAQVFETGNASDMALAPDGSTVYVTGCGPDYCGGYVQTVAYSVGSGRQLWTAFFKQGRLGVGRGIAVSPDGTRVFVTGNVTYSLSDPGDYQTIAYDAATGHQLWTARYNAGSSDTACCVRVSPDGTRVYVTGQSLTAATGFDYATVAYDATTGSQLWVVRYNGPIDGYDIPTDLGVSPDGATIFVTGGSPGPDLYNDYATVAYDASTGAQLWATRYNNPNKVGDSPYSLAVSPDGYHLFVTGCQGTIDDCVSGDYLTIAYDTGTGTQLWLATYNGPVDGLDSAGAVGVSPDGSLVFVTGSSDQLAGTEAVTIAYDAATGSQRWLAAYSPGSGRDSAACCLAVSADGSRVIVAGTSYSAFGPTNYATIAYDPVTGSQLWAARFSGGSFYNLPSAVVVTRNGEVAVVTGTTIGPDRKYDFGTVAYRA